MEDLSSGLGDRCRYPAQMKFQLSTLFWLILVVAILIGWHLDRSHLIRQSNYSVELDAASHVVNGSGMVWRFLPYKNSQDNALLRRTENKIETLMWNVEDRVAEDFLRLVSLYNFRDSADPLVIQVCTRITMSNLGCTTASDLENLLKNYNLDFRFMTDPNAREHDAFIGFLNAALKEP